MEIQKQIRFVELSKQSEILVSCFWEISTYWRQNDTALGASDYKIWLQISDWLWFKISTWLVKKLKWEMSLIIQNILWEYGFRFHVWDNIMNKLLTYFLRPIYITSSLNLTQGFSFISVQKQPPEVFCKKGVIRNFAKHTEKYLFQSLFFNKIAGL